MLEQRPQQIRLLGREIQIGCGQPVELADRIPRGNRLEPGGQRLDRLPVDRQDQPVEVAELVVDAADRAVGGFGDITNLQ